ncbi:MAG: CoA transferase [Candidatus Tectomicrobia bacterium]|uniref:CoA transferase n=1 Tax=Tectimicrobiota bacterium TaxID=2528274 RepID=A0A932CN45_UNCTE|nr:CoA transferase [Candidatus Tectomicrobia bacterium]
MTRPLDGIKVLELIRVAPGAFCTMMLADMGADVLKVETPPEAGAETAADEPRRAAFRFVNRNKRSIAINLKHPEGQKVLQQLAADADVLVEGFRPGVMARLGGDYATLSQINPRLIYCSLSGFGQNGPYRELAGHDINYLSIGGVLNLIGEPDRHPAIPLNLVADYAGASMHGVVGILLALMARQQTGRGQVVDISYLDTSISLLAATPPMRDFFYNGRTCGRGEGALGSSYPYYTTYDTADGKILSVGCVEPWLWENFCKAIGREDLGRVAFCEEHFASVADSASRQAKAEVQQILLQKTRDEWFEFFKDKNVCVGPVYTAEETFRDPQVQARQMAVEIEDPRYGTVRQAGIAIKLSETPGSIQRVGPAVGEHTDEVLSTLGYGEAERAQLRQKGTVA